MKKILLFPFLFYFVVSFSQNTFQKVYNYPAVAQCFGACQTTDGNYITTGIADVAGFKLFVSKQDCEGNPLWSKTYNASSTFGNISQRVIESSTGGYVLAGSPGSFNAYNIEVIRMDENGNSIWKKLINGNGDDVVNAIIQTSDYGYAVTGKTNSYGQDAGSPNYEKGITSDNEFRNEIRKHISNPVTDEQIDTAWNELLYTIPSPRMEFLKNLKTRYRLFLLSNTNKIHIKAFTEILNNQFGKNVFENLFEKIYFSCLMNMRKPDIEIFNLVIEENQLKKEETIFIDDSVQHVEGAREAGLIAYHLDLSQKSLETLLPEIL